MPYSLVYCGQQNGGHANHGVCLTVVGAEESRRRRRMGGGEGEKRLSWGRGREGWGVWFERKGEGCQV